MFLIYAVIIFVAFMVFREIILDNANVKTLDFSSAIIVFIAASSVPEIIVLFVKIFIKPLILWMILVNN